MMATPAAATGEGSPGRTLFRSPNLLLLLLGFVFLSIYGSVRDEKATTPSTTASAAKPHGSSHQGGNVGPLADDFRRDFSRGKHDEVGAPTPFTRVAGEVATTNSTAMTARRRRKELGVTQDTVGRHPLEEDVSGGDDSPGGMIRRMGEESLGITEATLEKLQRVIVVQAEGIVYCPIPKTAGSEWRRALRWMEGVDNWAANDSKLYVIVENGLERLIDRGLQETRWAFESDRFMRFVVVREPAERLVSAFLNKCVVQGFESETIVRHGAKDCWYLDIMPELFPRARKASRASHARFKKLFEADPEDTFYHFINGIWREAEAHGDTCQISNQHLRPQACFCDLPNLLPAFYVMPFSNLSVEAGTFASRLPAALPDSRNDVELEVMGVAGTEGVAASYRKTGVNEARREEINAFLRERFIEHHVHATKGVTHAANKKDVFLSERVMEVVAKIYEKDYHLFGEYF